MGNKTVPPWARVPGTWCPASMSQALLERPLLREAITLYQWSSIFLALGTSFMEDNLFMDGGRWFQNDSNEHGL